MTYAEQNHDRWPDLLTSLQATISGAWWIHSYDLNGQETAETIKQESTTYTNQQAKVDIRGPLKASR